MHSSDLVLTVFSELFTGVQVGEMALNNTAQPNLSSNVEDLLCAAVHVNAAGMRYYQCQFCGKADRQKSHMRDHLRFHTGKKPFQCPYCQHHTSTKSNLKVHVYTQHGITDQR